MTDEKCGVVLYHATRKENLPDILENGLSPGAGKGWCHAVFEEKLQPRTSIIQGEAEKECSEYIFAAGSLDKLEDISLKDGLGSDTVMMICVPQEDIIIDDKPFDEWEEDRGMIVSEKLEALGLDVISNYREIKIKNKVLPKQIIGCIDIIKDSPYVGNMGTYKVNSQCIE